MDAIYTHDEAARIVGMFESVLERYGIKVPSPEDDEREPDNSAALYGSVYSELLDTTEYLLIQMFERYNSADSIVTDIFSGNY